MIGHWTKDWSSKLVLGEQNLTPFIPKAPTGEFIGSHQSNRTGDTENETAQMLSVRGRCHQASISTTLSQKPDKGTPDIRWYDSGLQYIRRRYRDSWSDGN